MSAITWVKEHPVETGGIVFVGGMGVLWILGVFSGGSSSASAGDPNASAYYAAQAAQAQAGDALQAVQIQSAAATAQTALNDSASTSTNATWAATDLATQQSNNATTVTTTAMNDQTEEDIAPYQVESNLISTLGQVASVPGSTSTVSSSNGGFFGIGASSSTYQTYTPNPAAVDASGFLGELLSNGFHASS